MALARRPRSPTPPRALERLKARVLGRPGIERVGLTTTADGTWALKVWLREGALAPLAEAEAARAGYPVVYDRVPAEPPVARPAYPALGE